MSFSSLARDRVQRRVMPEAIDQLEKSLKLSKIPDGFVTFNDIENLGSRELAYTAHLASRLGMQNEQLWDRIRKTFLESVNHRSMNPKFLTQILIGIKRSKSRSDNDEFTNAETGQILRAIVRRIDEYQFVDLVLIMNYLGTSMTKNTREKFLEKFLIFFQKNNHEIIPKIIPIFCSALGKMNLYDERVLNHLKTYIESVDNIRLNDIEFASITRYFSKFSNPTNSHFDLIYHLLRGNQNMVFSPTSLNIVLNSVFEISKKIEIPDDMRDHFLIQQLDNLSFVASSDSPELIPHLFFYASGLSKDEKHFAISLRLANKIWRQYGEYKAVAIPLVVEGLKILNKKFSNNPDIVVLLNQMEPLSVSVIEKFLLVAPREEKIRVLESTYSQYSENLKMMVEESLKQQELVESGEQERRSVSPSYSCIEDDLAEILVSIRSGASREIIQSLCNQLDIKISTLDSPCSIQFFSRFFQLCAESDELIEADMKDKVIADFIKRIETAPVTCILRCMRIVTDRGDAETCFNTVCDRITEVRLMDIYAFLRMSRKLGFSFAKSIHADKVESRIASALGVMKSVHMRDEMIRLGKLMGLEEPQDAVERYEEELILVNRRSR